MSPSTRLKALLNGIAGRYGYKIEKVLDFGGHKLDVFQILIELLDPRRPGFFFVQVEANDGQSSDPIHHLIKLYHWKGVLVEPLSDAFARLTKTYEGEPQLIMENAAVAREEGTLTLWTVAGSNGQLATFDRAALLRRYPDESGVIEVPVRTISMTTLLAKHRVDHIDLLQIDAEGFDYEVIKMTLGGSRPRPRLIRYEHLHLSPADRVACVDFLGERGYKMYRDELDTVAYLPPDRPGPSPTQAGRDARQRA
jgi:FkbM family methyltransferase